MQTKPKVDLNRLYITGFSYGGLGAYALAQHFPGTFAAVVPIAALTTVLSVKFNRDIPLSVGLVAGSTLLSIVTMPPIVAFAITVFG